MHFYSTISYTLRHQLMVLQIQTLKDQVKPDISQWEMARPAVEEKQSERNEF